MLRPRLFLSAIALVCLSATLTADEPSHVKVSLMPEVRTIAPGAPFSVAVWLKMDPRWHTYWINPGDSGAPTEIKWNLPPGFEAGPIQWPHPERIEVPPLVSFGYEGEAALLVRITPPRDLKTGERVTLAAHVSWLECEELCLPGEATVSAVVQTGPNVENDPTRAKFFSEARARLPLDSAGWSFAAGSGRGFVRLTATPPVWLKEPVAEAEFFSEMNGQFSNGRSSWDRGDGAYVIDLPLSDVSTAPARRLTGVLVSKSGWRGPGSERAIRVDVEIAGNTSSLPGPSASASASGLLGAIGLAFIGGLILNLMPCVFPVLSLKVLSLVGQADAPMRARMRNAGAYSFGVLVAYWALAGLLIALRAGGEQLGWGFQLQSPPVIAGLASLFFLLALNLFGVFEVGMSLTRLGGKNAGKGGEGAGASFSSGLLATIVATPCTAPFMGSALGFALTQPAPAALAIFTSLGAGMAAPFVALAASPRLLRILPRPGAWMETMKQALGFLLAATVVWLAWVLGQQTGSDGIAMLLAALVVQAVGAWVLGKWAVMTRSTPVRTAAGIVAAVLIVGSAAAAVKLAGAGGSPAQAVTTETWEPYSEARVNELRAAGRPVFVDFGAAWCLTCQVNERVALSAAPVLAKFREKNVATLKADWTSRDPAVTQALTKLGRGGVPTYVLYSKDASAPPRLLPEVLTPTLVIDVLDKL
ncbi:MAG TPA: thioredoxin family protein [Thermoanaerobaculia bacterium]|nr:thioredoxin family protein [Thermoanaerobaculia bacterium]